MTASERVLLEQAQHACRGQAGNVPVTVLLDRGHAAATVAQALGVDAGSVYRYAQTYRLHGLAGYLRAEQPEYLGPAHQRSTRRPGQGLDPTKVGCISPKPTTMPCARRLIQGNQSAELVV